MEMKPVTAEQLCDYAEEYETSPERRIATLALSRTSLPDAAYSARGANAMRHKFSVEIKTLKVTDQKHSGRCWLFAAANVLRERIAAARNLENFELSQSYLAFWDKFERCNYFLESILQTASLPVGDRTVMHILNTGVHDGGQWDMFANIVRKYGIVPKDEFDETYQSENTSDMNSLINQSLKRGAMQLRRMAAEGADEEALQEEKNALLDKVFSCLCSCYGEPPRAFDFEFVDKDGNYHIEKSLTPLSFAERYVGDLLDRTVSIINAPTSDKPYHKTYTIRLLGNIVGGNDVKHLNLPMDEFKAAVIRQLEAGKVVWFGSDVSYYRQRANGIWDDSTFDYEAVTGLDLVTDKADALDSCLSAMNHAMVLTGVNLDNGKPTRWKIENSWGDEHGKDGYYICSDSWFDRFVYQAAVEKEYLGNLAALYEQEPAVLEPWDPMGTLAD